MLERMSMSSSPVSSLRHSPTTWLASALLAALAPSAHAEDQDVDHGFDARLGFTSTPAPKITEKVSSATGETDYDWKGGNTHGQAIDAGARWVTLQNWGGLVYGGDLVLSQTNSTPAFVERTSDGADFSTGGLTLHYRTVGVQVACGYGYATSRDPEDLAIYVEVLPFLGVGGAQAETAGQNTSGDIVRRSGLGYYYEAGLRGGIYFTERHFLFGFTGQYAAGSGKVDIDLPGGGKSKMTAVRHGLGFGVDAGWRF
jgi:hypothetical protein